MTQPASDFLQPVVQYVAYPSCGKWQVLECYSTPRLNGSGQLVKALSGRYTVPGSNLKYRVLRSLHFKREAIEVADTLNILNELPLQNLK